MEWKWKLTIDQLITIGIWIAFILLCLSPLIIEYSHHHH